MSSTFLELPAFSIRLSIHNGSGTISSSGLHDVSDSPEVKAGLDAVESTILAHALAGVDVCSPAYLQGLETTVMALGNNL